jgi:hypothetical protein
MAILKNITINDTGNFTFPSGTIAQRPSSPTEGMIRNNTELQCVEYYDGTDWLDLRTQRPPIVTNGLVFNLDAGDAYTRIDPVGANTIVDLSSGYVGSAGGTVTYKNDNQGIYNFNSGSIIVTNDDGFGESNTTPTITMEMWVKLTRKSGGGQQFQQVAGFRNDSNFDFFFLLLDSSGATVNTEARLRTASGLWDISADFTSYFGNWTQVVFIGDVDQSRRYIKKKHVGSNSSITGSFGSTSGNFAIGLSPAGSHSTLGDISSVKVYNRALSTSEIQQNYDAHKRRFGLT